jgi:hypothetical protein
MRLAAYNSDNGDSGGLISSNTFPGVAIAGMHEGVCWVDLGGGPFALKQYTFQTVALFILGLNGWIVA